MTAGYLGIDVGLSGIRVNVISRSGRVLAQAQSAGPIGTLPALQIARRVDRTVRRAVAGQARLDIAGIAVAAYGPAPLLLDADRNVVAQLALFANGDPGKDAESHPDDLAARLRQFRRISPRLYGLSQHICDLAGYLVWRLTGHAVMDRVTAADYKVLPLPRRIRLPEIENCEDRAGDLLPGAARRLGLTAGIPVSVGAYDSTADLLAAGFGASRGAVIVLGSTMVLGALTSKPVRNPSLRSMPHVGPGWFSGGWTNCAGASVKLADRLLASDTQRGEAGTPMVWPYFVGERAPVWAPQATGMIAGLTPATTAAALRAGFIQGIALSAADIAERLCSEIGPIPRWTVIGGATRNHALMKELADALGATLCVVNGAAEHLGPAVLAARSAGIRLRLPIGRRFSPQRKGHVAYRQKLRVYRQVVEIVRPLLADLHQVTQSRSAGS